MRHRDRFGAAPPGRCISHEAAVCSMRRNWPAPQRCQEVRSEPVKSLCSLVRYCQRMQLHYTKHIAIS